MSTTYPGTLPRPQQGGYGLTVGTPITEVASDRGLPRARGMGAALSTTMTLRWIFTEAQLVTFATWFRDDLAHGTLAGTMTLRTGYTDAAQSIRFMGPYTQKPLSGRWEVAAVIELLNPPQASASELAEAIANYTDLLQAANLHRVVHVDMYEKDIP